MRMKVCRVALLRRDHTWEEVSMAIPDIRLAGLTDEELDTEILNTAYSRFDDSTLELVAIISRDAGSFKTLGEESTS